MRKFIWFIFITISFSILFIACSSSESYADKLKKEKKEIEKFLSENNIKVLENFPERGYVFAENEYYKDAGGTYVRVINWGDENYMASTSPSTRVSIRFNNTRFLGDTTIWKTTGSGADFIPMEIEYGDETTYSGSSSATGGEQYKYLFMSTPCIVPLEHVGNKGEVSLLVPFVNGSTYQRSVAYQAIYFGMMRYVFVD